METKTKLGGKIVKEVEAWEKFHPLLGEIYRPAWGERDIFERLASLIRQDQRLRKYSGPYPRTDQQVWEAAAFGRHDIFIGPNGLPTREMGGFWGGVEYGSLQEWVGDHWQVVGEYEA